MASKKETLENLRIGYQAAVSLVAHEGELVWSRFMALLTIQTILVTLAGFIVANEYGQRGGYLWLLPLSVMGLIFCFLWFAITSRGFAFYYFWLFSARELEEKLQDKNMQTLQRGDQFRQQHVAYFAIDGTTKPFSRPWFARSIKTESAAYWIIGVFFLIYAVLFGIGFQMVVSGYFLPKHYGTTELWGTAGSRNYRGANQLKKNFNR